MTEIERQETRDESFSASNVTKGPENPDELTQLNKYSQE
jgi:hypothetical protein